MAWSPARDCCGSRPTGSPQSPAIVCDGWHDVLVVAKQLVVTRGDDGDAFAGPVERHVGDHPWDYEDEEAGREVPRLGTQALLTLAQDLQALGYQVTRVDVRDGSLWENDEETEEFWSAASLQKVRKRESTDREYVRALSRDIVVVGVDVQRPGSPFQLFIRRGGEAQPTTEDSQYLVDLQQIWQTGTIS